MKMDQVDLIKQIINIQNLSGNSLENTSSVCKIISILQYLFPIELENSLRVLDKRRYTVENIRPKFSGQVKTSSYLFKEVENNHVVECSIPFVWCSCFEFSNSIYYPRKTYLCEHIVSAILINAFKL
jgi:hypothetical protein